MTKTVSGLVISNGQSKKEKPTDNILYTLKINNTSLNSKLEVHGKLTKEEQDKILFILGVL